jgi:ubiquinone/menaquinone biosynthesis C-methylase UbiE
MRADTSLSTYSLFQSIKSNHYEQDLALIKMVKRQQPKIDELVLSYLSRALGQLGLNDDIFFQDRHRYKTNDYLPKLRALKIPRSKLYWVNLLMRLLHENQPNKQIEESKLLTSLQNELPFYQTELSIIQRIGDNLNRIMRDESTSTIIQILFSDDLMSEWYANSVTYSLFIEYIKNAVKEIVKAAGSKTLRVLEVGAGTGGVTSHLLEIFNPRFTEYIFTDISHYFLRLAQRKFKHCSFTQYRQLNLEESALHQDFQPGYFDVVVANNVIHDTKNILFSLNNLRGVMTPQGFLILLELTNPQLWWHVCFGSLEGWWRFKLDPSDRREDLMFLDREAWRSYLNEAGFSHVVSISDDKQCEFANTVFLAQ